MSPLSPLDISDDDNDESSVDSSLSTSTDDSSSYNTPTPSSGSLANAISIVKGVRFLIPSFQGTTHQGFMTTDPAPVAKKFGPVHRWGKVQLGWLNVNYSPTKLYDFLDRKSTSLNSSHLGISYAVFCLKK